MKICVIGAGIIGLSSAVRIQDRYQSADITVIADKFSPNTLSDTSEAVFAEYKAGNTPSHLLEKWSAETLRHLKSMALSPEAAAHKIQHISGYWVGNGREQGIGNRLPSRRLTKEELQLFPKASWGQFFTSYFVEPTIYLPWLMKRFTGRGGKVVHKTVKSLEELYPHYDMIVNCSGLGSYQLVHDTNLVPHRGQAVKVHAPWIKHFYHQKIDGEMTYILPGSEGVILGGTFQKDNWNDECNQEDQFELMKRCCEIMPSLKAVTAEHVKVGLRPVLDVMRVELEPPSVRTKCRQIDGEIFKFLTQRGLAKNGRSTRGR
ncbi:D-aspartate oxidase isoform X3 [Patella vulgata]|uniref:D-aspartate oxidase isoform X2 n=1 Tax=Patella vulgata TaxID=6465 RepID=UPI0024A920E1|nr:D-aspartate oxidase isoform X2 [Patella vulgata]XP_050400443.2 D-aspartate oxidase isoform X3 [Patella vulgata]